MVYGWLGMRCKGEWDESPRALWSMFHIFDGLDSFVLCSVTFHGRIEPRAGTCRPQADGKDSLGCAQQAMNPAAPPNAPLPAEYWDSVLKDRRAGGSAAHLRDRRLSEFSAMRCASPAGVASGPWKSRPSMSTMVFGKVRFQGQTRTTSALTEFFSSPRGCLLPVLTPSGHAPARVLRENALQRA
jgi:hypothetical protein